MKKCKDANGKNLKMTINEYINLITSCICELERLAREIGKNIEE